MDGAADSISRAADALKRLDVELPEAVGHDDVIEALDELIAATEAELTELSADDALRERLARLTELVALRTTVGEEHLRQRLLVFGRIQEALGRLRDVRSTDAMIRRAPAEVALACDMDRVVIYRIDGGMMLAEAFFIAGDEERAERLLEFSRREPAPLHDQILEREMLRRRRPLVVRDAQNHPSSYKPFVTRYDTHAYVAAPIMPEGRVIGFLHADKGLRHPQDPRGVDELDRDALWAFAEGFGYAVERMQLLERLRAQSDEVRSLISRTESVVAEHLAAQVELASGPHGEAAAARTAAALLPASAGPVTTLTRRELEVLALIADGATNVQIAGHLVISESTAKSHVKRILRKLGAGNRVEAASMYLRAQPRD
jgi:DNA-binding CsgD family transcriptional regulator